MVNKGGKIGKKKKQLNIRPRVGKKWIVSERKGIRAVCILTPLLFSRSFNINFKVRSQKNGHIYFFGFASENFNF